MVKSGCSQKNNLKALQIGGLFLGKNDALEARKRLFGVNWNLENQSDEEGRV
jgi:hypothetical protein